jgi:hypothetical protein
MACLQSAEYVAGYEQAVKDMVKMFEYKPVVQERPVARRGVLYGGKPKRTRI